MAATAVLAHQGGWDEVLLVLTPIAIFVGLLRVANKRADHLGSESGDQRDDAPPER